MVPREPVIIFSGLEGDEGIVKIEKKKESRLMAAEKEMALSSGREREDVCPWTNGVIFIRKREKKK